METEPHGSRTGSTDSPTHTCDECGTALHHTASEYFHHGRNHWSVETACPNCGTGTTECGKDIPNPHARSLLIEQTGLWVVTAHSTDPGTSILRALRRAYNTTLADTKHQAEQLRSHGITGTHGEALRLAHHLQELGVTATIAETPQDA